MYFIKDDYRVSSFNPDTYTIIQYMEKSEIIDPALKNLTEKMLRDNAPKAAIEVFADYYRRLKNGASATIP
jgi:hypothetical protein